MTCSTGKIFSKIVAVGNKSRVILEEVGWSIRFSVPIQNPHTQFKITPLKFLGLFFLTFALICNTPINSKLQLFKPPPPCPLQIHPPPPQPRKSPCTNIGHCKLLGNGGFDLCLIEVEILCWVYVLVGLNVHIGFSTWFVGIEEFKEQDFPL